MATLSGALAAFLLAISCAAVACNATCDLHALAHSGASTSGSSSVGMEHCSAPGTMHSPGKTASLGTPPAICLGHPVCGNLSVFFGREHRLRVQLFQLHAAAALVAVFAPLTGAPAPFFPTPPLRTASLQTTLRI